MPEMWDIYDINKNKTGKQVQRNSYQFKKGEYHIVVTAIIINSKNEILISKRAAYKKFGLMWECNGGSILAGETSLEGVLREIKEELGIEFLKEEAIFLKEIRRDKIPPDFKDLWLFRKDININDITFPDGESIEAKWVSIDKFLKMFENREIVPTVDFGIEEYNNDGQNYTFNLEKKQAELIVLEDEPVSLGSARKLRKSYLWSKKIRLAVYKIITYFSLF